jgi:hypothetical protein
MSMTLNLQFMHDFDVINLISSQNLAEWDEKCASDA